jgi:hypothetical protein
MPRLMPRPEATLSHILPLSALSWLNFHHEPPQRSAKKKGKCMMAGGLAHMTRTQAKAALMLSRAKKFERILLVGRMPRKMVAEAVATAKTRSNGKPSMTLRV